jgi:hypothetical protein
MADVWFSELAATVSFNITDQSINGITKCFLWGKDWILKFRRTSDLKGQRDVHGLFWCSILEFV